MSDVVSSSLEPSQPFDEARLLEMDSLADKVIAGSVVGTMIAYIPPPPFDIIAVSSALAGLGAGLAKVYEVEINATLLKTLGKAMARGMFGVLKAYAVVFGIGEVLKWIPGGVIIAYLTQYPVIGWITYSTGEAFKQYFRTIKTEGRMLTPEEVKKLAEDALRQRLDNFF